MNEKLNLQTCCICLEEQSLFDIENNNLLIEYQHCGNYYVHKNCLSKWKPNECLICRKNLNNNETIIENENESDNENVDILIEQNNRSLQCKLFINLCIILNFFGIGVYYLITNKYI